MKRNQVIPLAPLGEDTGRQERGVVCLANEERFTATNYSEPLTAYGVGYALPANLQAELDRVAPPVEVPRRFEFKSATNAQEFLSEADDIRAIGAAFKRVEYKGTSVNQKTFNKGLTIRLDKDEDLAVPGAEERAVGRLKLRLFRNELRRAYALLVAGAINDAKTWDATAGKSPDLDVETDMDTGGDARGIDGNIVVYGRTAWLKRKLSLSAQTAPALGAAANLTPDELAASMGVDAIIVSKERYQTGATTKAKLIGGAYVLMFYAEPNPSKDDPSNIKRFVTPTVSGLIRVYREETAKFVDVSVEHYSNIVLPTSLGIRMFTIS